MKLLVIPEDQSNDRYIIKPVFEALLADAGIPGRVTVLPEPRLRGAQDALNARLVAEIVSDNPMVDVFVLVVDRDCDRENHTELAQRRADEHSPRLFACLAVEEVEVWMLALHRDDLAADWKAVRAECDRRRDGRFRC